MNLHLVWKIKLFILSLVLIKQISGTKRKENCLCRMKKCQKKTLYLEISVFVCWLVGWLVVDVFLSGKHETRRLAWLSSCLLLLLLIGIATTKTQDRRKKSSSIISPFHVVTIHVNSVAWPGRLGRQAGRQNLLQDSFFSSLPIIMAKLTNRIPLFENDFLHN